MKRAELLNELIEYLKAKYSVTGIASAELINGCMTSAVDFAIDNKAYKLAVIEAEE